MIRTSRIGFSLLELILFLGILSIIAGTLTAVSISTQEVRIRQQYIAEVEQRGTQLLETMAKTIRRSETVLLPLSEQTGALLALQMAANAEEPTLITSTASGNLILVQKTSMFPLLSENVHVQNLSFQNFGNTNVVLSFDLETTIPLPQAVLYTRHFETTATLFPDDQSEAGGCGSCPLPLCVDHQEQWYYCSNEVCTLAGSTFACP